MRRTALLFIVVLATLSTWAQKTVVWETPLAPYSQISCMLNVTKVELTEEQTTLTLHVSMAGGREIGFTSQTILQAEGKDYKIKCVEGHHLDAGIKLPASGEADYMLRFEAMPLSTRVLTFTMPGMFSISNIHDGNAIKQGLKDTYWRNDMTGEWVLAVADDAVVYDSKVWAVTSLKESKDTYVVEAENNGNTIRIDIGKQKKQKRTITIGNEKMMCSMIAGRFLPDYPTKDTNRTIANNNYREGDSITLTGWFRNMPRDLYAQCQELTVAQVSIFNENGTKYAAPINSQGHFTLRMPIENTTRLFCDWGISTFIAEPNETYFILRDFSEDRTLVMGRNARLQNEMLAHEPRPYFPNVYDQMKEMGAMPFLQASVEALNKANEEVDKTMQTHSTLSERYRTYCKNAFAVELAKDLMQGRYEIRNLPEAYLNYVTDSLLRRLEEPYTLSSDNMSVALRDYSDHLAGNSNAGGNNTVTGIFSQAEKDGIVALSDGDRKVLKDYEEALAAFYKKMETARGDEARRLQEEFGNSELQKKIEELFSRPNVQTYFIRRQDITNAEAVMDAVNLDGNLKDMLMAGQLIRCMDKSREPLLDEALLLAKKNIKLPMALNTVLREDSKYRELASKSSVSSQEVCETSEEIKQLSDGEQIIRKLIEPHKGKLVLIDIWGTWCSPCKAALSHSREEYDRLNKYGIVYVYLANRSGDAALRNVIREYGVSGDNVFHYNLPAQQQNAVENYLKVRSFPSYRLFDRQGKLLDVKADPRNLDGIESVIKEVD